MQETEYLRLRARLDAEHRRRVQALDETWSIEHSEPPPEPFESHSDALNEIQGGWRQIVANIIDQTSIGAKFTVTAIAHLIKQRNPLIEINNTYISQFLKTLADDEQIVVFKPGAGRRATIYEKIKKA